MKVEREVELPGPLYVRWSIFDRLTILARQKHTTVEALLEDLIDDGTIVLLRRPSNPGDGRE